METCAAEDLQPIEAIAGPHHTIGICPAPYDHAFSAGIHRDDERSIVNDPGRRLLHRSPV